MSTDYERQKKYMDSKKARGYAKKALWIHESKYPELKQEAERLNREAETPATEASNNSECL